MKKFKQILMPFVVILLVSLGISPHSWGQGSQVFSTPGASSFTIPPGVTTYTIKLWGAGGGGGNSAGTDGQGGGGGGAFQVLNITWPVLQTYNINVGAGGTAGNPGGNTTAGGTFIAAGGSGSNSGDGFGGIGGFGVAQTFVDVTSSNAWNGGYGGASTNPVQTLFGGGGGGRADNGNNGGAGTNGGTTGPGAVPGVGGSVGGGAGGNTGAVGGNATSYGGGGGGRGSGGANSGTGGNGRIEFSWPCPVLTSISYTTPVVCSYSTALSATVLPASAIGGTYTCASLGAFLNATTGVISTGAPQGTYTISYGWPAFGGCPASNVSTTLVIAPQTAVTSFSYGGPYCSNAPPVTPTFVATGVAGTFTSSAGLAINSTNGVVTPALSTPGTYTVTYTVAASGNCNQVTATANITITALPTISNFDYPPTGANNSFYCAGAGLQMPTSTISNPNGNTITYSASPAGLSFSASTGEVNPASSSPGAYTVKMEIAAGAGCAVVSATTNVTILATPTVVFEYSGSPYCRTVASTLQSINVTSSTGGPFTSPNFTATPSGLTITSTNGDINLNSSPGVYTVTYTFTGANGCPGSSTTTVTIKARPKSTIAYTAGTNPVCSNVSPVVSGTVTAVGPWTLTLSNGQTTTGTGSGPWSITLNDLDPGETNTYSVTGLIDANCSAVANPDLPGSVTITKRTITSGVIQAASNVSVCKGNDGNVDVTLLSPAGNCQPNPQFTGVFKIEKQTSLGTYVFVQNFSWNIVLAPSVTPGITPIPHSINIPASILTNTTSNNVYYKITWVSLLDCNGCPDAQMSGAVTICVLPAPIVTVTAAPIADVCPGTNIVFGVTQTTTNIPTALFNWVATDAAGNELGSAQNVAFGPNAINTNLGLSCPFNGVVTFTIVPISTTTCCTCFGATTIRTVTVRDIVKPTWTTLANALDTTLECSNLTGLAFANTLKPVATDNCTTTLVPVKSTGLFVSNGQPCTQSGKYTNTWTVTDNCGNISAVYTQVITITDTTKPVLTGTIPPNQSLINSCKVSPTPPTTTAIAGLFTDNCGTVSASVVATNTGDDCNWSFTYTYTVKDNCGNTVIAPVVIVFSGGDKNAPVLKPNTTFPIGMTEMNLCKSAAPVGPTAEEIAALYVDACGGAITVVKSGTVTGTDCNWEVTYTYTVRDKCNNFVLNVPTIRYQGFDAIAPVLSGNNTFPQGSANNNVCYNNVPAGPTEAAIAAIYVDNCGGDITVVKTNVKTGDDCSWSIVYSYSIKDKCGNQVLPAPTVTYTGGDKTAPVLITAGTFPVGNTTAINSCYSAAPNGPTKAAIAALYADNCGGLITVDSTRNNTFTSDCNWSITYSYTVKDKCNNFVLNVPVVTYFGGDKTAPVLITAGTFPAGQSNINACYSATLPLGPTNASIAALYVDNCGGAITVDSVRTNTLTSNCNWSITYTYTVKDKCDNVVTPKPTVTYSGKDLTAPVFTNIIPTQIINTGAGVGCSGTVPNYVPLAIVTDCGSFTVVQKAPYAPGTSVFGYNGSIIVTLEATDGCGNKSTQTFTVLLKDSTKPNALCKPATVILNAAGVGSITVASVNNGSYDNCTPTSDLITTISNSTFNCSNTGENLVKLYVTDLCGNIDSCTATVTVIDNIAPVISCFGDTIINKDASCSYVMPDLTFRVNKADACGPLVVTQFPPMGSIFAGSVTSQIVTLTVKDPSGNTSTCTFKITFKDVTAPVFSNCPPNISVNTGFGNTACSQTATWTPPTAADACTPCCTPQVVTSNYVPGATFPVGVTTVTYSATDLSNNTSTCSFTVTVVDNTKPIIANCPGNVAVNTGVGRTSCDQVATWIEPTATDNCPGTLTKTRSHAPGATFPVGTTAVTYTFTDAAGNVSNVCTFNVVVTDNTAPIIACPASISSGINAAGCLASVVNPNPTYSDNCPNIAKLTWAITGAGITTAATSPSTGINFVGTKVFNIGVSTVTYTVTDAANNTATCSYTVTVVKSLAASIAGTSTVLQNTNTTTAVAFTSSGGTAPYTIVYNSPVGGYPLAGGNATIVTNGTNSSVQGGNPNTLVTTVPQPNSVPGTYTYTLVSVTDFYGCVVTPGTTATVTIVASASILHPDLAATITSPLSSSFIQNELKEGVIEIENVVTNPTTGNIQFKVFVPSNYTLLMNNTTTVSDSQPVDNSLFTVTLSSTGLFYTVSSLPTTVIGGTLSANNIVKLGFKVKANGPTASGGKITVTIGTGTGGLGTGLGDNNSANNQSIQIFSIN